MKKLKWIKHSDLAIKKHPSMHRDEYLDWMTFKGGNRIPFTEIFGPLIGLKEEWEEQGASEAELDFSAFLYREPELFNIPVTSGRTGSFCRVVEENDERAFYIDDIGRTLRLDKGYATIPLPENYPVKNMSDWLKIKDRYEFCVERLAGNWAELANAARARGAATCIWIPGAFDEPRQLIGEEMLCYACYDQPELLDDIMNTIGNTVVKLIEALSEKTQLDILCIHEDMAGKSGSLWGPDEIRRYAVSYYRKAWDCAKAHGARLFDQDSDGDMNGVIPAFLESGLNCMHPMEPASNMDIVKVRSQYGNILSFKGGIDKHVLRRTKKEIESELEYKIPPMIKTRGCMLGLDHRIPNGVSLDNYRFYIDKVWEIIKREEAKI